jgi:hypothetical protein
MQSIAKYLGHKEKKDGRKGVSLMEATKEINGATEMTIDVSVTHTRTKGDFNKVYEIISKTHTL